MKFIAIYSKHIFHLLFLMMISFPMYSQKTKFIFIENIHGINEKNDSLPFFLYEKEELDSFIRNIQYISPYFEAWGVNAYSYITFRTDSLGKIVDLVVRKTDVKINQATQMNDYKYYDTVKLIFEKEAIRILTLTEGLWSNVNMRNPNDSLRIMIPFETEAYKRKNKEAWKHNGEADHGNAKTIFNPREYYNNGVKKMTQKKHMLAQRYFELAVSYDSKDNDALYNLGVCYLRLKNKPQACKTWKKAKDNGDSGVNDLISKYCE